VSCCCVKLIAEAPEESGNQDEPAGSRYQATANEDVTVDTSACACVCITVNCNV
jgi:hypothetical protein